MNRLDIRNLRIARNNRVLIKECTFSFSAGLVYAIVGNNGSGKTTLLKTLAGLIKSDPDHIFIDGHDINGLSPRDRANKISVLLQHSPDQPYCTAFSRIAHGLMPMFGFNYVPDQSSRMLIETVAKRLNIYHLLNRRLLDLSGGEQRLVHLAKCLINPSSRILLLDEPSVFLDFSQRDCLGRYLRSLAHCGQLILFSSHDEGFIQDVSDGLLKIDHREQTISHPQITSSADSAAW